MLLLGILCIILKCMLLNVNIDCSKNTYNIDVQIQVTLWNSNINILLHFRDPDIHVMYKITNGCILNIEQLRKRERETDKEKHYKFFYNEKKNSANEWIILLRWRKKF